MKETPMMAQYLSFKKQFPDKVVLFRMGDFYETFGNDAKIVSKVLNITLTSRNKNSDSTPLAGFPHHALSQYLRKLVESGVNAVVVDQLEDPKYAKGIVKRGVTRIVTPGTLDGDLAEEEKNPYLLAVVIEKDTIGAAYVDISTGEVNVTHIEGTQAALSDLLSSIDPTEVLIYEDNERLSIGDRNITLVKKDLATGERSINELFKISSLDALSLERFPVVLEALGVISKYLLDTQKMVPDHISRPRFVNLSEFMTLDSATIRNLDLVQNTYTGKKDGSLINVIDRCQTSMGSRLLYTWVLNPLLSVEMIDQRLDIVTFFVQNHTLLQDTRKTLANISDIERLVGKLGLDRAIPREVRSLSVSLVRAVELLDMISEVYPILANQLAIDVEVVQLKERAKYVSALIDQTLVDDPPTSRSDGGYIKEGLDSELDELRGIKNNSKEWVKKLQSDEREKYGIPSLKVGYNKVFGYYLEVTKAHIEKIPESYIRKQTLVNSERFITEELKEKEEIILTASDKIVVIENRIYSELRTQLIDDFDYLSKISRIVSVVDILSTFAENAQRYDYIKPEITEEKGDNSFLLIKKGRHPVIEQLTTEQFIDNDADLTDENGKVIIITGPNMSGKSTFIRQVALLTLMAQIGSFVPASSMKLSVVDRIFSRIGASDDLSAGRSTFMVEMEEAANILNNATSDSLILLDEVGRGTSTYDGVSIAWALVEYLVESIKARTLFATHYHELITLEGEHPEMIRNYNVEVVEKDDEVIFLRKIIEGSTDKSYGIYVASMAGIPASIIERANEIIGKLDIQSMNNLKNKTDKQVGRGRVELQYAFFDQKEGSDPKQGEGSIVEAIRLVDIDNLTPIEALKKLAELKSLADQSEK